MQAKNMLLENGVALLYRLRLDPEKVWVRKHGRVDDDGSRGLVFFDEKNEIIEVLPAATVEFWKIIGPDGEVIASNGLA